MHNKHLLVWVASVALLILQYCFMPPLFYPAQDHICCVGNLAGWQPQWGLSHVLDSSVGLTAKTGRLPVQTDRLITACLLYTSHCQSPAGHAKNLWAGPRGAVDVLACPWLKCYCLPARLVCSQSYEERMKEKFRRGEKSSACSNYIASLTAHGLWVFCI